MTTPTNDTARPRQDYSETAVQNIEHQLRSLRAFLTTQQRVELHRALAALCFDAWNAGEAAGRKHATPPQGATSADGVPEMMLKMREAGTMFDLLTALREEYFADRIDADVDADGVHGNAEARWDSRIALALARAEGKKPW